MPPDRIINVHTHIHKHQDIDARVKLWRGCGVVKVCVQAISIDAAEAIHGNEGVLQWMRKYPDIILGFGYVELGPKLDPPEQVGRLKEQGFTGLKFIAPSEPYDHECYFPFYERAQALAMPILFHTGFLALSPSDRERRVSTEKMRAMRLDAIGRAFPDLRIIMAHLGNPEFHVGLSLLDSFENLYGEFSGHSGSKWRETTLRKVFAPLPGANMQDPEENHALRWFTKLCFATDNPEPPRWIALSQRLMDELQLPQDLQERFWWKNAAEALRLTDPDCVRVRP
jgi:hypothetical protein